MRQHPPTEPTAAAAVVMDQARLKVPAAFTWAGVLIVFGPLAVAIATAGKMAGNTSTIPFTYVAVALATLYIGMQISRIFVPRDSDARWALLPLITILAATVLTFSQAAVAVAGAVVWFSVLMMLS